MTAPKVSVWTRLRRFFSSTGRKAAQITHRAFDLLEEILPDLLASGRADPKKSDSERRFRAKQLISQWIGEKYPATPRVVVDLVVNFAFDALRDAARKA
jgi:hypothetical protein